MDVDQFLLEDLKLKIDYLNGHLQRMWTRFNFFITIESILIGLLFSSGMNNLLSKGLPFVLIEVIISIIWWIFSAQDRYLVTHYRNQVKDTARRIVTRNKGLSYYVYHYVGATPEDVEKDPEAREQKKRRSPIEWRIESLSPTKLAALFPLLIGLTWLLVIVILLSQKL